MSDQTPVTGPDDEFPLDQKNAPVDVTPTVAANRAGVPWRLTLFLILMVLVVVFSIQNTQVVELKFLAWSWQLPLVTIILATLVVSVLLDEILGGIIKRRRQRQRLEKEELKRLRQGG